MSLILGIHLLRKLYLVSDTRVTTIKVDGKNEYSDNFLKFMPINKNVSAVSAGNVLPAAYIITELRSKMNPQTTITEFKDILQKNLGNLLNNYVKRQDRDGLVAFIFAGFNPDKKKKIETSRLGNTMSAPLVQRGDGSMMNQSIDRAITNALVKAMNEKGYLPQGTEIEVDVPDSEMFSLEIDIKKGKYNYKQVECYDYAIFHPGYWIETIELPIELRSSLEFRTRNQSSDEGFLYEDASILMNFVAKSSKNRGFASVGGQVITFLQTPHGAIFPTGDIATIRNGQIVPVGGIYSKEGKICYKLEDGTTGAYTTLLDTIKSKSWNKADVL